MKVTVITINYNDLNGLKRTVSSVKDQTFEHIEYILVDGGSDDGSAEYLSKHDKLFSSWLSEPDKGIYNAMNKGIDRATGDYILFLNSGDILHDENVIKDFVDSGFEEEVIYGRIYFDYGKDQDLFEWKQPPAVKLSTLYWSSLPHQATFFKKSVFSDGSRYDESLKIVGDWAFNMRLFVLTDARFRYFDRMISIYDKNGLSSDPNQVKVQSQERRKVISSLFSTRMQTEIEMLMAEVEHDRKAVRELRDIHRSRFYRLYERWVQIKNR